MYMSPQMLGSLEFGKGTDVWSLGLIFYQLLTLDEPRNNPKLNPIDFKRLEISDIPLQWQNCPRAFALFKCIYMKMIVFAEQNRASVEEVMEDEAFDEIRSTEQTKAMGWQIDDLQERNELHRQQLKEKQNEIDELKRQLTEAEDVKQGLSFGILQQVGLTFINCLT